MAHVVAAHHSEECMQNLLYEKVKLQVCGPYMWNTPDYRQLLWTCPRLWLQGNLQIINAQVLFSVYGDFTWRSKYFDGLT